MIARFYDKLEEWTDRRGKKHIEQRLMFYLLKESKADVKAEPFEFDGHATESHIQQYRREYNQYLKAKDSVAVTAVEMQEAAQVEASVLVIDGDDKGNS